MRSRDHQGTHLRQKQLGKDSGKRCQGNSSFLRGQDLDFDRDALTRAMLGRRANPHDPDASLFLLKATGQIAHEGGPRFAVSSDEYRILRDVNLVVLNIKPEFSPRIPVALYRELAKRYPKSALVEPYLIKWRE